MDCGLELTEPLSMIAQLDAKFHDKQGNRSVITITTQGEKSPSMMGFQFEGEGPQAEQFDNLSHMMIEVRMFFMHLKMRFRALTLLSMDNPNKANQLEMLRLLCAQPVMMKSW